MIVGKTLCILQARMGSSRLPGKVLMPLVAGKGALELMLERLAFAERLEGIVVATSDREKDRPIVELCRKKGTECFRGSETDVLDRFYRAAVAFGPVEVVVRLTADCPLVEPSMVDRVVERLVSTGVDYASNIHPPTYPDGLDVEALRFGVLERLQREVSMPKEREHVTLHIRKHPERFKTTNAACEENLSHLRWTLDTREDLALLQKIFEHCYPKNPRFGMKGVLAYLGEHPEVSAPNARRSGSGRPAIGEGREG
jgi:spore coat polysaccharide biosynthesis protein SpsF